MRPQTHEATKGVRSSALPAIPSRGRTGIEVSSWQKGGRHVVARPRAQSQREVARRGGYRLQGMDSLPDSGGTPPSIPVVIDDVEAEGIAGGELPAPVRVHQRLGLARSTAPVPPPLRPRPAVSLRDRRSSKGGTCVSRGRHDPDPRDRSRVGPRHLLVVGVESAIRGAGGPSD
jgi:hypothetical protein